MTHNRCLPQSVLLALSIGAAAGCDGFPKDPNRTLEKLTGATMHVGVTEAPPWITRDGDQAHGIEPDLLRAFAGEHGAIIRWHWNAETRNLLLLERSELAVVAAGITSQSPWKEHVAFTRPYYSERSSGAASRSADSEPMDHVMAVEQGENAMLIALDRFLQNRDVDIHPTKGSQE